MMSGVMNMATIIHRHTGGLEKLYISDDIGTTIHRHTGGLEKTIRSLWLDLKIHRHTGGLEIYSWVLHM
ncbi:hypothetical protein [uncultured Gammaproteobacteria bacterium]|nr:hypothetical protein [uncultured Gammaproteobacteria bacterium]CAC9632752.1 hypothetical protein [uncultured Gammaproteobacteria bacterium]CAC9634070.1 hypothetical protein [uncultured Gammaproteobacteria bacterium]CAC9656550.1 hypothetical protein [uncultured Gammaproteobacteria bacterium]